MIIYQIIYEYFELIYERSYMNHTYDHMLADHIPAIICMIICDSHIRSIICQVIYVAHICAVIYAVICLRSYRSNHILDHMPGSYTDYHIPNHISEVIYGPSYT